MASVALALFAYWCLCAIGGGYFLALDPGTLGARERAEAQWPKLHRMVTCHPCACGWTGCVCACVGWSCYFAFGMVGIAAVCVACSPVAGLGLGALCGMLGGSDD